MLAQPLTAIFITYGFGQNYQRVAGGQVRSVSVDFARLDVVRTDEYFVADIPQVVCDDEILGGERLCAGIDLSAADEDNLALSVRAELR